MGKPKSFTKSFATHLYDTVTPMFVHEGVIDDRYFSAVNSLVDWAGADWADNDRTGFFLLRDRLIVTCEKWKDHDWAADEQSICERKKDQTHLPALWTAFRKFKIELEKSSFRYHKAQLGLIFWSEFISDDAQFSSKLLTIDAVESALERFDKFLEINDQGFANFGCIRYRTLPPKLCKKEIALALALATIINVHRKDGLSEGNIHAPFPPILTRRLPWKAIAEFASANSDDKLDIETIQTRVTSLTNQVDCVDW
jgi:hypothetical protein